MSGFNRFALQWALATSVHGHIFATSDLTNDAGVTRCKLGADVAGYGGDRQDVESVGCGKCQQQRDTVIDTRVAVDDD
jgi:hypothetical protein